MVDPRRRAAAALLVEELEFLGVDRVAPSRAEDDLEARIRSCHACPLAATRTQVVPGEGPIGAAVMFVGEAPGRNEDLQGRPFVGASGQLLTKIIEGGMGLRRDQVYIANVLKCRPPDNRDPTAEEKACCTPFLDEQIARVGPRLVIALGRHAAGHLLGRDEPLARMRGRLWQRPGHPPLLATYHPAYLLHNPAAKRDCWQDIQIGMRHLGLTPPAR